jgi:hypothetical protein
MRWVEKTAEKGDLAEQTAYVVLDAEARALGIPLVGVSEEDAERMVSTGGWRWVYEEDWEDRRSSGLAGLKAREWSG